MIGALRKYRGNKYILHDVDNFWRAMMSVERAAYKSPSDMRESVPDGCSLLGPMQQAEQSLM